MYETLSVKQEPVEVESTSTIDSATCPSASSSLSSNQYCPSWSLATSSSSCPTSASSETKLESPARLSYCAVPIGPIALPYSPITRPNTSDHDNIDQQDDCPPTKKRKVLVDEMLTSLKSMDPTSQFELWHRMLSTHPFDLEQLKTLRDAIDERIKVDIISGVPYEIASYIMSFLSPKDLCQAGQTCRSWRVVCEDNRLWREKCSEEGLLADDQILSVLMEKRIAHRNRVQEKFASEYTSANVPKSQWKAAYLQHINILRNWQKREFVIKDPFIATPSQPQQPAQPIQQPQPQEQPQQQPPPPPQQPQPQQPQQQPIQQVQPILHQQLRHLPPIAQQQFQRLVRAQRVPRVVQAAHQNPLYEWPPARVAPQNVGPQQQQQQQQQQQPRRPEQVIKNDPQAQPDQREPQIEDLNQLSPNSSHSTDSLKEERSRLMQLRCHEDSVITCLQYNPKTNIIVSGSDDHTLKVWCSETGRCLTTLEGHTGGVWASQLSPDDIVISGATDRTLNVWRAHTGELLHTLYGHGSTVRCLALCGDKVVSGSRDTTLRLWDINQGTCLNVFLGHSAAVRCVEFKGDRIVSGAYDHLVMVWDATTGQCLHVLERHLSRIYSLQFDGKTIASGSLDSTICIWDADTGKLRHHLEGHKSLTSKMQLKGNLLVSANADSYCKVWDVKAGECIITLAGPHKHTSAITSVYFNCRHVVTSSDDGTVKLWDIKTGEYIRDLVVLPTAANGGVVWRIRASYTKLICAVGSRSQTEDTHLLVLDFDD